MTRLRRAFTPIFALVLLALLGTSGCGTFHHISPAPDHAQLPDTPQPEHGMKAYWVGHSTMLVGMSGRWVITDPVFSNKIGLFARRYYRPGIALEDLSPLDVVLISHPHLDHLDVPTLERIDPAATVVCSPAACPHVPHRFRRIISLAPWQTVDLEGMTITATPAKHEQSRYYFNAHPGRVGSVGFVVSYHAQSFYFAGDTGYRQEIFDDVHRMFPDIDLAIMPVGPVNGWTTRHITFRNASHLDPGQAITAFRIVGARYMVPVHWHTFFKSTQYEYDRIDDAVSASGQVGRVIILNIGQAVFVPPPWRTPDRPTCDPAPCPR
jgi:L-ascorbate metabolism protein UlaG (beta-lactamase superfamily)